MLKVSDIVLIVLIVAAICLIVKAICCLKKRPAYDALPYAEALLILSVTIQAIVAIARITGI